jgi:hypothetical protein
MYYIALCMFLQLLFAATFATVFLNNIGPSYV